MKKYIIILATVGLLAGCETKNVSVEETITKISGRPISIYVIDSCQYIGNVYGGSGDMLTHKGNCNNPIHK